MSIPCVGVVKGEIVPSLRAVEVALIDFDSRKGVEEDEVVSICECFLFGRLQPDGDIVDTLQRIFVVIAESNLLDVMVALCILQSVCIVIEVSQFRAVDNDFADRIFEVVVDRSVPCC